MVVTNRGGGKNQHLALARLGGQTNGQLVVIRRLGFAPHYANGDRRGAVKATFGEFLGQEDFPVADVQARDGDMIPSSDRRAVRSDRREGLV